MSIFVLHPQNQVPIQNNGNSLYSAGNAETLSNLNNFDVGVIPSGTVFLTYFTPPVTTLIRNLGFATGNVGAAGTTLLRMGIYTANGVTNTLVARTASQVGGGVATFSPYIYPLDVAGGYPSSYVLNMGQRYALAFVIVGTTPCSLQGDYITFTGGILPIIAQYLGGQADLATSYLQSGMNPSGFGLEIIGTP